MWEGLQLQQLEWCRLLQSCCWVLQCSCSRRHMQGCVSQGQRCEATYNSSSDLSVGWASCEVATAIVVKSTGVFGSPEAC